MLASSLILTTLAGLVPLSTAGYVLEDDYSVNNFFSMFDFFTVSTFKLFSICTKKLCIDLTLPTNRALIRRMVTWIMSLNQLHRLLD